MTDEQPYAFPQEKKARNNRYQNENAYLKELKPIFDNAGFEIFNCNPESKCDVFQYMPFNDAVDDCKGGVPNEPFDTEHYYNKDLQEQHFQQNPDLLNLSELKTIYKNDHALGTK